MNQDKMLKDFVLLKALWEGIVKRKNLMDRFGISESKATKLIRVIREEYAGYISYSPENKGYISHPSQSYIQEFNFHRYSSLIGLSDIEPVLININDNESKPIKLEDYRLIHKAIQNGYALQFKYSSFSSPEKVKSRLVYPHHIVNSGVRWHIRGYDASDNKFKDFNVPRLKNLQLVENQHVDSGVQFDDDWNTYANVYLVPNPVLNKAQQRIVEEDYSMKNGQLHIVCRKALLLYTLNKYLIIEKDIRQQSSKNQHLVMLDCF